MGEASILEAINLIKSGYSIDDSKIYLMGSSNGAAASWAVAQAYPYLFAGILVFSGVVNIKKLNNVGNLRIINISSPYEYLYKDSWEKPTQYLHIHKILKEAFYILIQITAIYIEKTSLLERLSLPVI